MTFAAEVAAPADRQAEVAAPADRQAELASAAGREGSLANNEGVLRECQGGMKCFTYAV